ncbi:hypothetical protein [Cupriavidus sp. TMH.W2]|uniref:hypothetical protein n=1 Tax=Cupriavidus sp. TMH.W2 TaxID=3434465 RepID=UPI003D78B1E8
MNTEEGFAGILAAVDEVTKNLGGSHFMRLIVAKTAQDFVRAYTEPLFPNYQDRQGMTLSHYLFATPEVFDQAAGQLKRVLSLDGLPAAGWQSDEYQGGRLVLRDNTLRFETGNACFSVAKGAPERSGDKWRVFLTDSGEAMAEKFGKKPSVTTTYAKSADGVMKSMRRLAEDAFRSSLTAVAVCPKGGE